MSSERITNLPQNITADQISRFHFGDPDATNDQLILKPDKLCVCPIRPIEEFLKNDTSILLGERGAGKTCIFELLANKVIQFRDASDNAEEFLRVDARLDFKAWRDQVIPRIVSEFRDESLKYMLVWQIWIAAVLIQALSTAKGLPKALKDQISYFEEFFSPEKAKLSVIKLILGQKKQVGFKVDLSRMSGLPVCDFYTQWAPPERETLRDPRDMNILKLEPLKQAINDYAHNKFRTYYVLIDKIDEFVLREDYGTQQLALQGLLDLERSYAKFPHIRLKIFLRSDLFDHLDKSELGADKVYFRTTNLEWSDDDIVAFMSRRILTNYTSVFGLDRLEIQNVDREKLYVDKHSNDLRALQTTGIPWYRRRFGSLSEFLKDFYDHKRYRHTSLDHYLNMLLVKTFFGDHVSHHDKKGALKPISIEEFLRTHFTLASGHATPRVMLMFLRYCILETESYYRENQDLVPKFPIVPKECVCQAYARLRDKLWNLLADDSRKWKHNILQFRKQIREREFTHEAIKKHMCIQNEEEMRDLLAVMQHLGIIRCKNKEALDLRLRKYEYPTLFRFNPRTDGTKG